MKFKGLRFAGLEWRNIVSSKVMWVVIAAIAIMPLLYGALYLAAFKNPYANLNTVPVAVVNNDKGAEISGQMRIIGDDVVARLKDTQDGLQWNFVTSEDAWAGLENGTYFMSATIPENFSQNIASVEGDNIEPGQLEIVYNQSENMLASQIGESVWKEVRQRVSDSISYEYWTKVLGKLSDTANDIQAAADGASKLHDGLISAEDGSAVITDNLGTLNTGAASLNSGLSTLKNGATKLDAGTGSLADGANSLQSSLVELSQKVGNSSDSYAKGSATLLGAANDLASATLDLPSQMATLSTATSSINAAVNTGLAQAQGASISSLQSSEGQLLSGLSASLSGLQTKISAGQSLTQQDLAQVLEISQKLTAVNSGRSAILAQLSPGVETLAKKVEAAETGAQTLSSGASVLRNNLVTLSNSVGSENDSYSNGDKTLLGGANDLEKGAQELSSGTSQLSSGAQAAQAGSLKIESGSMQLKDGSLKLTKGLADASSGSEELATKLGDGATLAARETTNIPDKADAMSNPVRLNNEYFTTVKNYGTGFAPYFMSLGLWVGCLIAGFVFSPLSRRMVLSGANPVTAAFTNFIPMAVFAIVQATLLMVVLQFVLQLQIDNIAGFYAMGYLIALVFAAILQFLLAAFGFPGRFLAIIFLMLQLTSCAGTFPIQMTPQFFQTISTFMPMTYGVEALRQIMTGVNYSTVAHASAVLLCIGVASFALTCFVAYKKRTVSMVDLHPLLQLG